MNREPGLLARADRAAPRQALHVPGFSVASFHAASTPGPPILVAQTSGDRHTRIVEVIVALIIFLVILPVMILIAIIIKCTSPGPIIFAHDRVGRGLQMFRCLKFRTMMLDADDHLIVLLATDPSCRAEWAQAQKLRKDPRITRLGAFLRKTSLDELPQLLNVLRGDMNLVGPRPIVPAEMFRYGRYIRRYCSVRPGITGLWQISGRNHVSYSRRVALDVLYVRSRSLPLNLYILSRTLPCVIAAEDTY